MRCCPHVSREKPDATKAVAQEEDSVAAEMRETARQDQLRVKNAVKGGESVTSTSSAEITADASVETYIKEQVNIERLIHANDNLLRRDAPRE